MTSCWDVIAVTCKRQEYAKQVEKELHYRQQIGMINPHAIIVAIADPQINIGSGGATINALLIISELLSGKFGYTVVTGDVLKNCRLVIMHMGRDFPFDSCGRSFTCLPLQRSRSRHKQELVTNFDVLFDVITFQLAKNSPPGLWVCSSDMLLKVPLDYEIATSYFQQHDGQVTCISVPTTVEYAMKHGVYNLDNDGTVCNLTFQGSEEEVRECRLGNGLVPIVAGVLFFPVNVAEKLLSMHLTPPLDACTYLGADNGVEAQKLSLFFDIVLCMVRNINERDFVAGMRSGCFGKEGGKQGEVMRVARAQIWKKLNNTKMNGLIIEDGEFTYFDMTYSPLQFCRFLQQSCRDMPHYTFQHIVHSHIAEDNSLNTTVMLINSIIEDGVKVGDGTSIMHSHIPSGLSIGRNCLLLGVDSEALKQVKEIGDNLFVMQVRLPTGPHFIIFPMSVNLLRWPCKDDLSSTLFSNLYEKLATSHGDDDLQVPASFQNMPTISAGPSLFMSKIYPTSNTTEVSLQSVFDGLRSSTTPNSDSTSFHRLIEEVCPNQEFDSRHARFCRVASLKIGEILRRNSKVHLGSYFGHFVHRGRSSELLNLLDNIAISSVNGENGVIEADICARALACIADVLETMAPQYTLLRSGPSLNKDWKTAVSYLNQGILTRGVEELTLVRNEWVKDNMLLIRAARHYEGAAQILISIGVMTVCAQIKPYQSHIPIPTNKWLIAECPARIDFSGGWSDTPPICFEHGGSVVNAAILINGKRPIGARLRKIKQPIIVFRLLGMDSYTTQTITCNTIESLTDFTKPCSPGALLKACVILSRIVQADGSSIEDQLTSRYGGGLELQTWSHIPQGSGLGTSSILAGAVLKVLFAAKEIELDSNSLIHLVLILEQMLTTGGGWQDQIGGILGGIKIGRCSAGLPLLVKTEQVACSDEFITEINARLKLIYTGKTRLARNLLQNVIRNWYGKSSIILRNCEQLVKTAEQCAIAFHEQDLANIGSCINNYWKEKKVMAPGSEPALCSELFATFEPISHGASLAGAGGGGFMYVLFKENVSSEYIRSILGNKECFKDVEVYDVEIDPIGMVFYEQLCKN